MNRLVTNAVGLQAERGDNLSLYSLPFTGVLDDEQEGAWYLLFEGEYAEYIITALAVTLLLFIGLLLRLHFYRKQIRREREQARIKTLRQKESKEAAEAGLVMAVHPDDKLIERARQLSLRRPQQVALLMERWIDEK